jgi:hypothetical protein
MKSLHPQPLSIQPSAGKIRKKYLVQCLVTRIEAGPLFPGADGVPTEADVAFFTSLRALAHRLGAEFLECPCCGHIHWFQFRRSLEEILGLDLRCLGRGRVVELAVALARRLGL